MGMKIKVLENVLALTKDRVYDANKVSDDIILMDNDNGHLTHYHYPARYFEDVTFKYNRNTIIDEILL